MADPADTARRYFDALIARDPEAMAACWSAGAIDRLVGQAELTAPDGVRDYFAGLFAAFPDLRFEVLDLTADGERCAVRWRARGTFAGPGTFQGFAANGAALDMEGCDVVRVRDGMVVGNDAYVDAADIARQLGLMPPRASAAERGLTTAANARARLLARLGADDPEQVADGVWLLRGGFPGKSMNAYLIADGDGVTLFDAAVSSMGRALAAGAARLGGLRRVVLGHGHVDHRGGAAHLRAPVLCHPDARADVEGDAGQHYMHMDRLAPFARPAFPFLMSVWDGGPLSVTDTVREGDDVAGFRVIDLPGHAPGQIGLWREADRVALCSDCFYTLDSQTGLRGAPRIPHAAFNHDTQQAHDSLRKLAALEPRAAWAGHADPVVGDVRAVLEHAADTT